MSRKFIPLERRPVRRDAEKLFVLAFEGTLTEKKYFEDLRCSSFFQGGLMEIVILPHKEGATNPISVQKLLLKAKKEFPIRKTDEFWLLVDRDDWETIHHIDWVALAEDCQKNNLFLALSNPCFEMWLLFHFKELDDFTEEERECLFRNERITGSKHYIDEALASCIGDGRGYNKRPNPGVFLPRVYAAIRNAKQASHDEPYPRYLGSDVFKLVQKLVKPESEMLLHQENKRQDITWSC